MAKRLPKPAPTVAPAATGAAQPDLAAAAPESAMAAGGAPHASPPPAGQQRQRRRRRTGTVPGMLAPFDLPEDAEGRVAFIALQLPHERESLEAEQRQLPPVPSDLRADARGAPSPGDPPPSVLLALGRGPWRLMAAGWLPVVALAVVFVVIFLVGRWVAR